MKKIILIPAFVILATIVFPSDTLSQADTNGIAYQSAPSVDPFSMFRDKNYFVETHINNISIKAVRHFITSFKDVANLKWYTISDGFIASFTKDSIETKVVYDKEGAWHCTLNAFSENRMPSDIRDMVKRKYYDFNILIVYEIEYPNGKTYIIKIGDKSKIKILKILNGEIEVVGDYRKG